jgi:UDP-N-acetylmuramate dehydrogenase
VVGNAGTAKEWIGDKVKEVEVLDEEGKIRKISGSDCQFDYRSSRFKKTKEIVLRVVLKLKKSNQEKIRQRMAEFMAKRANQPKQKSAGSIFKNPKEKPAGWLIERCGLKGKRIGDAQIFPKHANFIVNLGRATAEDVIQLIKLAKKEVQRKFGVKLKEEICLIGFGRIV